MHEGSSTYAEQRNDSPHRNPHILMLPHISHMIRPPRSHRPVLRQIEAHLLGRLLSINHHEHWPVATIPRPIWRQAGCIVRQR